MSHTSLALAQNSQEAAVPYGCSLQSIYFLVELSNDAVQLCDPLLVAQRRSLLHILVLSHQVGLLTLQQRSKETERVLWTAAERWSTGQECTALWFSYSSNQQCLSKRKGQVYADRQLQYLRNYAVHLLAFFLMRSCHFCLEKPHYLQLKIAINI